MQTRSLRQNQRESGLSALFSALTGRTPSYGYHLEENRKGTVFVELEANLTSDSDYSALGYHIGRPSRRVFPCWVFIHVEGLTANQLKTLCTGISASSSIAMIHLPGLTAEGGSTKEAFSGEGPSERITVTTKDIAGVYESFESEADDVDFVCLGCPHASISEISEISSLLEKRKCHEGLKLWVCTSAPVKRFPTGWIYADYRRGWRRGDLRYLPRSRHRIGLQAPSDGD